MSMKALKRLYTYVVAASLLSGCTTPAIQTAPETAADPNAVVALIASGVTTAGNAILTKNSVRSAVSHCDEHGYPNVSNQSDPNYPGYLTHCFMSVDAGDTVIGGMSLAKNISCLLNAAGIVYDGVTHATAVTEGMRNDCDMPDDKVAEFVANITATSPAAFNSNYSHGVVIDLSGTIGLVFKVATKVVGTKSSFITSESWTDGSIGATAGSFDTGTGDLWYESRVERNDCTVEGRCGWNRHTRIRADLTVVDGEPTGLEEVSFAYSNIQFTPGQNGLGGIVVASSGDLTDGIKARLWVASSDGNPMHAPTATTDYDIVGNWAEVVNSACYTSTSETAGTCSAGLGLFSTNTKFLLSPSDSHMPVATWLTSITGQTFSAVNMNSDTQY